MFPLWIEADFCSQVFAKKFVLLSSLCCCAHVCVCGCACVCVAGFTIWNSIKGDEREMRQKNYGSGREMKAGEGGKVKRSHRKESKRREWRREGEWLFHYKAVSHVGSCHHTDSFEIKPLRVCGCVFVCVSPRSCLCILLCVCFNTGRNFLCLHISAC